MKYRSAFDIIGPVMIGPSSSHTAGAARIGRVARTLLKNSRLRQSFPCTALSQKHIKGTAPTWR